MPKNIVVAALIAAVLVACHDGGSVTDPTPTPIPVNPTPTPDHAVFVAGSSRTFSIFEGDEGHGLPEVRVYLSRDYKPVPGTRVTFAFSDGTRTSVTTDRTGRARPEGWHPDYTREEEKIIATADGISGTITFTASVLHKTIRAIYDLQSMGRQQLPIKYSIGPLLGDTIALTGGHYVLFNDGTYVQGYEIDGQLLYGPAFPFVDRSQVLEFLSAPLNYPEFTGLFATGTLKGTVMEVTYTDTIDFEDEVYRAQSLP